MVKLFLFMVSAFVVSTSWAQSLGSQESVFLIKNDHDVEVCIDTIEAIVDHRALTRFNELEQKTEVSVYLQPDQVQDIARLECVVGG
jgi:hypothetical protein